MLNRPPFRRPRLTSATVGVAIMAALLLAQWRHPDGLAGQASYLAAIVGGGVLAWVGVARRPAGDRAVWALVALGVTFSAFGDVIWGVLEQLRGAGPDASIADGFWLASYAAIFVALLRLLVHRSTRARFDVDGLLDMAATGTVAMVVIWSYVVAPTLADDSVSLFVRSLWAAYPILDAVLLALVARTLVNRAARARVSVLLAGGATCWLLADLSYLVAADSTALAFWMDAAWMAGAVLIGASTHPRPTERPLAEPDAADGETSELLGPGRVALGVLPLLVPWLIDISRHAAGTSTDPVSMLLATSVLVVLAYVRITRLIDADRDSRRMLQAREHRYRTLTTHSSDATIVLDAQGVVIDDSPGFVDWIGRTGTDAIGASAFDIVATPDRPAARLLLARALATPGAPVEGELRIDDEGRDHRWVQVRVVDLLADPDVAGVVVNVHDITDRKVAEELLQHQALHDALTGLPNRALFHDRVGHAIERNRRGSDDAAVIHLDLDGFKTVNDSLGHEAGDELLAEVARRLCAAVRPSDTVARLGGDEFAVLIEQSPRALDEAETVAARMVDCVSMPLALRDEELTMSASVGIAAQDERSTASTLLRDSEVAMYSAKTTGRGRCVRYEPEMSRETLARLRLESELAQVTQRGELTLEYQPVVALETGEITSFEALVRWEHPTQGTLAPDEFIPVAEETGAIDAIGRWVLFEACETMARWQRDTDQSDLTIAVNVSARQLGNASLLEDVSAALHRTGLAASALVLEMTETALVRDASATSEVLTSLRSLGVRLAIDDFGTGYSSLSYLRQFPIDVLKIDRSFVETVVDGADTPAIVRGLLELGHTLGLEMVAEGVEDDSQRRALRREGCQFAQGYLFSPPVPEDVAAAMLTLPGRRLDSGLAAAEPI